MMQVFGPVREFVFMIDESANRMITAIKINGFLIRRKPIGVDKSAGGTRGDNDPALSKDGLSGRMAGRHHGAHGGNQLPPICRHCTFHSPLADLHPDHLALKNITEFIGG